MAENSIAKKWRGYLSAQLVGCSDAGGVATGTAVGLSGH